VLLQKLWGAIRESIFEQSHRPIIWFPSYSLDSIMDRWTDRYFTYRVVISIASHIDLNTLDALSRTCRQVRANLLQFRTQLLSATLHCENEDVQLDPDNTLRYRTRAADWYFAEVGRDASGTGKVGDCARDLVGGCRRCGRVVCRVSSSLRKFTLQNTDSTTELHRQASSPSSPPLPPPAHLHSLLSSPTILSRRAIVRRTYTYPSFNSPHPNCTTSKWRKPQTRRLRLRYRWRLALPTMRS
jgi:hypothetical protein